MRGLPQEVVLAAMIGFPLMTAGFGPKVGIGSTLLFLLLAAHDSRL